MKNNPTEIVVHHSVETGPGPQFDVINALHRERDFPRSAAGYYVGYHYVIEQDGTVRQARELHEEGAHAVGRNRTSVGICLVGNFDIACPTTAQEQSLGALLARLVADCGIEADCILPHRTHNAQTHCFGLLLDDDWAQQIYLSTKK